MNRPIVICDPQGKPILALLTNEKGVKKSVERGELWALHPETERLLPVFPGVTATIADNGGWVMATLSEAPHAEPFSGGSESGSGAGAPTPVGDTPNSSTGSEGTDGSVRRDSSAVNRAASNIAAIGDVLADLAATIRDRHAEMPEGSYTTHLFSSGPEKIRKKVGEEAIEVVLASDTVHLVSETSDLIYHLLVLFEAEGIPLAEIAAELDRR